MAGCALSGHPSRWAETGHSLLVQELRSISLKRTFERIDCRPKIADMVSLKRLEYAFRLGFLTMRCCQAGRSGYPTLCQQQRRRGELTFGDLDVFSE